jgi:hypothetical protein
MINLDLSLKIGLYVVTEPQQNTISHYHQVYEIEKYV